MPGIQPRAFFSGGGFHQFRVQQATVTGGTATHCTKRHAGLASVISHSYQCLRLAHMLRGTGRVNCDGAHVVMDWKVVDDVVMQPFHDVDDV